MLVTRIASTIAPFSGVGQCCGDSWSRTHQTPSPLSSSHSNNWTAVSPVVLIALRANALEDAPTCGVECLTDRPEYSRHARRSINHEACPCTFLTAASIDSRAGAAPRPSTLDGWAATTEVTIWLTRTCWFSMVAWPT